MRSVALATQTQVQASFDSLIWAEESGGLSNNNTQWSFGNGATGNIGVILPNDGEILGMSLSADAFGTSVQMELMINGLPVGTALFSTNHTQVNFPAPVQVNAGDRLGFRTDIVVGGSTDVRVAAVYRQQVPILGNLIPGPQGLPGNDGVNGTGSTPSGGADVPGTQNVNTNTVLALSALQTGSQAGWSLAANELGYTGSPDTVDLDLMVSLNSGGQRPSVGAVIRRNGTPISPKGYSYIRTTSGTNDDHIMISFTDHDPGTDPSYDVLCSAESTITTATTATEGFLQGRAFN